MKLIFKQKCVTVMFRVHSLLFATAIFITIINNVYAEPEKGVEFKYEPVTSPEAKEIQKYCKGSMPAAEVKVTPSGAVFPENFKNYAQKIRDFKVRKDDIWVVSYPKSGSTWTQEMVWLLTNNVDIEEANKQYLWIRFAFLEYKGLCSAENTEDDPLKQLLETPENKRRYIKTHMPVELLPTSIWTEKPKMIHITRNPYDVAVSYFYHFQIWNNYAGTKELFFKAFLKDEVVLSPFWKHVLTYWKIRKDYKNILFITYEEMKKDLISVMKKVAQFLEVPYPEDKESALLKHLSFENMRKNKWDNFQEDIAALHPQDPEKYHYMRKGIVGSWKEEEEFQPFVEKFQDWTNANFRDLKVSPCNPPSQRIDSTWQNDCFHKPPREL